MRYTDLIVWQKSIELVNEIYSITRALPPEEIYSLTNQMRRAAVSIPSNIAEGYERASTKDYGRFLTIARGSRAELETQLYICISLGYINSEQAEKAFGLCDEIRKMITSLLKKLEI